MAKEKISYPMNIVYPINPSDAKWFLIAKDIFGKLFIFDKDGKIESLNKSSKGALMIALWGINFDTNSEEQILNKDDSIKLIEKNTKLSEWKEAYKKWKEFLSNKKYEEAIEVLQKAVNLWIDNWGKVEMLLWYCQDWKCFKINKKSENCIRNLAFGFYRDIKDVNIESFVIWWTLEKINVVKFIENEKINFSKEKLKYCEEFEKNRNEFYDLKDEAIKNLEKASEKWSYLACIFLWDIYWKLWNNELGEEWYDIAKKELSTKPGESILDIRSKLTPLIYKENSEIH